jgi:adenine phosphoribosyltransferase
MNTTTGAVYNNAYPVTVGTQHIELPIVPVTDDLAIALLITVDVPMSFIEQAGAELAELLTPFEPDVIVTAATMGIPIAWAVARNLGHDALVVLHKTPKTHLADALTEPLSSITTKGEQVFRLDRMRVPLLAERRVAFVDDVISTGGSAAAAMRLIETAGGDVCAGAALLTEGDLWRETLGRHAEVTVALGTIPVFAPREGGWMAATEAAETP